MRWQPLYDFNIVNVLLTATYIDFASVLGMMSEQQSAPPPQNPYSTLTNADEEHRIAPIHSPGIEYEQASIHNHNQCNIQRLRCGFYSNAQYKIFIPTYLLSVFAVFMMWTQVFILGYHLYIGRILCLYILYRYMCLGLSNPGLAHLTKRTREQQRQIETQNRYCTDCEIYVQKFTRHCTICQGCIEAYDHHCIFIGKCVGRRNIGQFKDFLCSVFATLIYSLFVALAISQENLKAPS